MTAATRYMASALASALLAGCGGGGGSDSNGDPVEPAGAYVGRMTTSARTLDFQLLLRKNGQAWAMYGSQASSILYVSGFVQADAVSVSRNGSRVASNRLRDFGVSPAAQGTTTIDITPSKSIRGSFDIGGTSNGFSGSEMDGSLYVYARAASLSDLSGAWSLTALTGEGIAMSISATGAISGTSALGCQFVGTAVPALDENVFDVSINFGPSPCVLPNQPGTGIAVVSPLATGDTQLIFAGVDPTRTIGTAAFGTRR